MATAGASSFDDLATATALRDFVDRRVQKAMDEQRPVSRYATFLSANTDQSVATIQFAGDEGTVTAKIGSIVPILPNEIVRIGGTPGNRFIEDVLGPNLPRDFPTGGIVGSSTLRLSAGVGTVTADWDKDATATQYRVQLSDHADFTVIIRDVIVNATTTTFSGLSSGVTYYVRVASMNNVGKQGAWTASGSVTVPGSSDAVSTSGGAGSAVTLSVLNGPTFIALSWTLATGPAVSYDVHISTSPGFTPSPSSLVGNTPANFTFVKTDASGSALVYGTTYYFKVIARNPKSTSPPSNEVSGTMTKIGTTDITPNAITTPLILAGAVVASSIAADTIVGNNLAAIALTVGKFIESTSYSTGVSGWAIFADGTAEFNNVIVRGALYNTVLSIDDTNGVLIPVPAGVISGSSPSALKWTVSGVVECAISVQSQSTPYLVIASSIGILLYGGVTVENDLVMVGSIFAINQQMTGSLFKYGEGGYVFAKSNTFNFASVWLQAESGIVVSVADNSATNGSDIVVGSATAMFNGSTSWGRMQVLSGAWGGIWDQAGGAGVYTSTSVDFRIIQFSGATQSIAFEYGRIGG